LEENTTLVEWQNVNNNLLRKINKKSTSRGMWDGCGGWEKKRGVVGTAKIITVHPSKNIFTCLNLIK
jgi:hypothetical protein